MAGGAACGCGSLMNMGCFSFTWLMQQPVLAVTSSSYVDLMTCKPTNMQTTLPAAKLLLPLTLSLYVRLP